MKPKLPWLVLAVGASCWAGGAGAQIIIGPQGSGLLTFEAAPSVYEWTTQSFGGDGGGFGIRDAATLDAQVQLVSVTSITQALATTLSLPPTQNNYARWNGNGRFLQSRIGNVEFTVTLARLLNNSGTVLGSIGVIYDQGGGLFSAEDVPGFRGYFSLTGQPGTWQLIPEFCTGATGSVSAVLPLARSIQPESYWFPGSPLYLLWADDNGPNSDGYYTLDNLRITLGPTLNIRAVGAGTVEVSWPQNWWNHELQVSTRLFEPNWQVAIGSSFELTNGYYCMRFNASSGNRYFQTRGLIIIPGIAEPAP